LTANHKYQYRIWQIPRFLKSLRAFDGSEARERAANGAKKTTLSVGSIEQWVGMKAYSL
jgi:hypothetical protein